jgi:hydroxypyruvate isomerase
MQTTHDGDLHDSNATSTSNSFATTARDTAAHIGRAAAGKLDEKRAATAEALESTAAALQGQANALPGGESVQKAAHAAAGSMRSAANRVRQNDVRSMLEGVQGIVRNYPGASLLTAAALGFVLTRMLSRD